MLGQGAHKEKLERQALVLHMKAVAAQIWPCGVNSVSIGRSAGKESKDHNHAMLTSDLTFSR